jgi:hypothetical protein
MTLAKGYAGNPLPTWGYDPQNFAFDEYVLDRLNGVDS